MSGCRGADPAPAEPPPPLASTQQPVWVNGDFESDAIGATPSGWTINTYLNKTGVTGSAAAPPTTFAQLNLSAGGAVQTSIVGGAPESQIDPALGSSASLRFPKYGQRAARVNLSNKQNTNSLEQTMTASVGDVDPTDNKVHIRFAVAPVLENPQHDYKLQPFYFVQLQNLTKNTVLYTDFNVSGQAGVPWKGSGTLYTDWQLVDIAPGNAGLAVGDQVKLTILAAGCQPNGHFGRIYVDAVGSGIPGLYSWATGPQATNAGDVITYVINYKNGGTTTTSDTALAFTTPPNTTFQGTSLGAACSALAVGATGTTTCNLGALAPGGVGSFTASVRVNANTATNSTITHGNYAISAAGVSALLGPKVLTRVSTGVAYADVGVTKTDGVAALGWGQHTTYTVVVRNNAAVAVPSVTLSDPMPPQLENVSWTCTASAGSSCQTAAGTGSIQNGGALAVGGSLTYTIEADVVAGNGNGQVVNAASVSVSGVVDPDSSNDSAVDTNALGELRTVSLTKTGPSDAGSVTSTPLSIACGAGCTTASGVFLQGSTIVLTAAPPSGASFGGWGGACAGTQPTCTLTVGSDLAVTANFVGTPASVEVAGGDGQSASVATAYATPLQARVLDAAAQPVPGVQVVFASSALGPSVRFSPAATAVTDGSGIARVTATANTEAGAAQVSARTAGVAAPAAFALTNTAGEAASMVTTGEGSPQAATVGAVFVRPLAVTVRDAHDNPVEGAAITFTAPASGPRAVLAPQSVATDINGVAQVAATAGAEAGTYTVLATLQGPRALASTFTLTNTPGAAESIVVVSGSPQTTGVGAAFTEVVVRVTDGNGNPVPEEAVTVVSPDVGASAVLMANVVTTDAGGQARLGLTANHVSGSYQVLASVAAGRAPAGVSLTNLPAAPASIAAARDATPQAASAGTRFERGLLATVRDAYGNPVPGATVDYEAPAQAVTGQLEAAQAITDGEGRVEVGLVAGPAIGTFSVRARVAGVDEPAVFRLDVLAGPPTRIEVGDGSPQRVTVLQDFPQPLTVRVLDVLGNPVAGQLVHFAAPLDTPSATLSAPSATTDANGAAQVTATAGARAGTYQVTAALDDGAAPTSFALTNLAGAVASVTADPASTPQTSRVDEHFPVPLAVVVRDAQGNPVPDVLVTFTAPAQEPTATLSASAVPTGADGVSAVTARTSTTVGSYAVTASVAGLAQQARFELAHDTDTPSHLRVVAGAGQRTLATAAFAEPIVARLTDAFGNPVANYPLTASVPAQGASVLVAPLVESTDADGEVVFTATANATPGAFALVIVANEHIAPLEVELSIDPIPTTLTLALSPAVLQVDESVQARITASSPLGTPAGTVQLFDAAELRGTATLVAGVATLELTHPHPGIHELHAHYAPQQAYGESQSQPSRLEVLEKPLVQEDAGDDAGDDAGLDAGADAGLDGGASSGGVDGGAADGGAVSSSSGGSGTSGDPGWLGLGGSGCNAASSAPGGGLGAGLLLAVILRRRRAVVDRASWLKPGA